MANPRSLLRQVPVGKLFFEVLVIVVGVLVALALNDWRDARKQAELERAALRAIDAELQRNVQLLDARLAYHESILQATEAAGRRFLVEEAGSYRLREPDQIPSPDDLGIESEKGAGIGGGRMLNSAWLAAISSGALTGLPWELFYQLSNTYTSLEELRDTEEGLGEPFDRFVTAFLDQSGVVAAFASIHGAIYNLVLRERELRQQTLQALELMGAEAEEDRS